MAERARLRKLLRRQEEARALREQGLSYGSIAERMQTTVAIVRRLIEGVEYASSDNLA